MNICLATGIFKEQTNDPETEGKKEVAEWLLSSLFFPHTFSIWHYRDSFVACHTTWPKPDHNAWGC